MVGKNVSSQAFFANVMHSGKPYISQAMQQNAPPKELITLLAAPVRDTSGRIVGILAASIPGSSLASLIGGTMLRDGGALVVFDQFGHAFTGPGASAKQSFASLPGVASALAGRTGAETGTVPGYSGQRLVGYAPVASTGWVVVVEEPSSVLSGPIDALTERLVGHRARRRLPGGGDRGTRGVFAQEADARARTRRRIDGERRRGCSDDRHGRE